MDSEKDESEIAPFKNIINEWVARDTSRKVKSAFKTKFAEGAHYGAYAPIGYKKHRKSKGRLSQMMKQGGLWRRYFHLPIRATAGQKSQRR